MSSPSKSLKALRTHGAIQSEFGGFSASSSPSEVTTSSGTKSKLRSSQHKQHKHVSGTASLNSSPTKELLLTEPAWEVQTPHARLGLDTTLSHQTASLGSSQFVGCQGDFCDFRLEFIEHEHSVSDDSDVLSKDSKVCACTCPCAVLCCAV
jgi:hypothetical protein